MNSLVKVLSSTDFEKYRPNSLKTKPHATVSHEDDDRNFEQTTSQEKLSTQQNLQSENSQPLRMALKSNTRGKDNANPRLGTTRIEEDLWPP